MYLSAIPTCLSHDRVSSVARMIPHRPNCSVVRKAATETRRSRPRPAMPIWKAEFTSVPRAVRTRRSSVFARSSMRAGKYGRPTPGTRHAGGVPTRVRRALGNLPQAVGEFRGRGLLARLGRRVRRHVGNQLYEIGYGWGPRLRSEIRKRWILLSHRHANIVFEGPVHIGPGFSLYIPHNGSFIVGPNVEFRRGFRAEVVHDARVAIGANCVFSYYSL